ncbi:MAG: glycosyl hydrolase [Sulfurimonadaceae bacterium]|nr:glycosyl hydrolase [Sulfurimonadaceae bacterium]
MLQEPFIWDSFSDQPAQLKDRAFKKQMRRVELFSLVKTYLLALLLLPLALIMTPFIRRKHINSKDFFCLGIDFERYPDESLEMISDLKVERILLRFKLWEMDTLPQLKQFIMTCHTQKITLKIIQDRENITDLTLLTTNLRLIFSELGKHIDMFEIGTTINRAKWGFFSVGEYNRFYQTAYNLREKEFSDLKLIGSGAIDFEFHFTAHTLFNFTPYRYDGVSSLLYVDRRGAPENLQLGFDLSDKIALLSTLVWLSPKSAHEVHITETNWPISNTAPYAPTSEYECVSEELYAAFMLRYYLLAFASQQVNSLSWHQLIAPGYGLVDSRDGLRKREAYYVYKTMVEKLSSAQFLRLDIKRGYYICQFLVDDELLQIHWALTPTSLANMDNFEVTSYTGEPITSEELAINETPIYIKIKNENQL